MSEELDIPEARALSVHLAYIRKELDAVVQNMATKDDIAALRRDMNGYAKAESVAVLETRVSALETGVKTGSVGQTFRRWANNFLIACAVCGVLVSSVGGVVTAIHWVDSLKAAK